MFLFFVVVVLFCFLLITLCISMYIMCGIRCLFSALSCRVGLHNVIRSNMAYQVDTTLKTTYIRINKMYYHISSDDKCFATCFL